MVQTWVARMANGLRLRNHHKHRASGPQLPIDYRTSPGALNFILKTEQGEHYAISATHAISRKTPEYVPFEYRVRVASDVSLQKPE